MGRLTNRAFDILRAEVDRCAAAESFGGQVQQQIVMKRLEKLRSQSGNFASAEELRETVKDIFPNFSKKAIDAAAKANRPAGILTKIAWVGTFVIGAAGFISVLNLPFPMIRWPVAKTAPILLLPSYISMDYNYRQAIAKVEQADQLVNKATASADFDLGEIKAKEAQKHLDALPVWFLGYYPRAYCTFFGCTWRFTFDEFEAARKNIGRMEAQIFQQKNALTQLTKTEQELNTAKQQYQQAKTAPDRQKASAAWQSAIDQLDEIPNETLAGEMAGKKLQAAKRDFQEVGGVATGSQLTDNLIEAAKEFGMSAAVASQNPPHSAEKWEQIADLWQESIQRLEQVSSDNPGYLDAQNKLAQYKTNLGTAQLRLKIEEQSAEALNEAKSAIADWQNLALSESPDRGNLVGKLREIINKLENIKPGTTTYLEAQKLLQFAKKKQQELQR
ncbi:MULTISPECIES: hypothetical protein [Kamptonema]|uniref:hypothetical protein n=1 Tax=Kamptonema TaxID=1501433 RepID=UPI0001DACB19|nr:MULTISPECIES: hypothetical protein [Kamptonema]CBN56888.1 conserved hypothetical protein [Kamptonema sp. PCC 6506]